jgi:quinol monooxygenase YgiN
MIAVLVEFTIETDKVSEFSDRVQKQAQDSLEREEGCHYFDVCQEETNPAFFFLYELYTDRDAFDLHLKSQHFQTFDATVSPWVREKKVRILDRHIIPTGSHP